MKQTKSKTNDTIESAWICDNPDEVYKYTGQWIAVVGEKIVAHGEDLEKVAREAEKYGVPLFDFIMPDNVEYIWFL